MAADRQLASITKAQAVTFEHDANRTPATPFPTQTPKLTYMTDSEINRPSCAKAIQ